MNTYDKDYKKFLKGLKKGEEVYVHQEGGIMNETIKKTYIVKMTKTIIRASCNPEDDSCSLTIDFNRDDGREKGVTRGFSTVRTELWPITDKTTLKYERIKAMGFFKRMAKNLYKHTDNLPKELTTEEMRTMGNRIKDLFFVASERDKAKKDGS